MITHSESIKAIAAALFTFQGAVDGVEKNKVNPGFKSRYANLEAVRDTAVPELQKVGLLYTQSPGAIVDGVMAVTTMIIHAESGEWMKFEGDIALGKRDPQGVGSAITYMQRYSLMAALGLPPVDDDGEGAMERPVAKAAPSKASAKPVESQEDVFVTHLSAITSAKDMGALETAFKAMRNDGRLIPQAKRDLIEAKDAKKAELLAPGNNFDAIERGDVK
jgi:hypothetical protein